MRDRIFRLVLIVSTGVLAVAATPQGPSPSFVVHEWGTFTSIAGADGRAVPWVPQSGRNDLPCFVERTPGNLKLAAVGTVRMETPVLYFYSPRALDASVHVAFPQGLVTEWYPHATVPTPRGTVQGEISWPIVAIQPGAKESFPSEDAPSHYYAARQTDADPVRVGAKPEKFLFYRGLGQFQPPLSAIARDDGSVAVRNLRSAPAGDLVFFENRAGAMTFATHRVAAASSVLPRPSLDDASGPPVAELKRILIANGLYAREAQAMLDTWKDSWFEEGARLLYIVSREDVDAIVPLAISPAPRTLTRVFVGRIELMTPQTLRDVRAAIASSDRTVLAKYGRFLDPIAQRLGLAATVPVAVAQPATACSHPK
jgi:hypothetical protein